jgi:PAS domain S-box-containing protein
MEQIRSNRELRDSEHQLRAVYESALDAFLIAGDDGTYLSANPAACALFGVSEEGLLGHRISDFMAPGFDFEQAWRAFLEAGRGGGEIVIVRPDGTRRDVEFNAVSNVLPGRHLSILRDVTERKRVEDALELLAETGDLLSESLDYQVTLQNVARLAVPLLADWCVLDLLTEEGELERLVAVHADPAKQALVEEMKRYPPTWNDSHGLAESLRNGQPLLIPHMTPELLDRFSRSPEHRKIVDALEPRSALGVPLVARGKVLGTWTFIRSHADRPYGDADLRLAETLARRAALAIDNSRLYLQAAAANRAKDQFLAMLSHELRTPLTPVLALVSKLERSAALQDESRQGLRRDLGIIRKNVELEARLIDDLLDLTRISRGKVELQREVTPVHPLLLHAVEICCADAVAAGWLTVETGLRAPDPRVWADGPRLTQVFWNLLSNAVKFTPRGGTIRVSTDVEAASRTLVIEISDTGKGIDPDVLPRIFDAFEQGRLDTARHFGGLGLGLAISKAILDAHGGSLAVRSGGKGQGTTFTIRMALYEGAERSQALPGERSILRDGSEDAAERPLSILLVEDHVDTAEAITDLLREQGHHVLAAGSIATALERAAETPGIDLVISDLGLPDGDGRTLMRELRDRYGLTGIAFSGYGTEEDRRESKEAGFAAHLTKPVTLDALLAEIRRVGREEGSDAQRGTTKPR